MRNRLTLAAGAISLVLVALTPTVAWAGATTSCSFDAGTATVTATVGPGGSASLERSGTAITFAGLPCGAADVTNTDQINISAPDTTTSETITISMAAGTFAPGKTAEGDGSNEIEIAVNRNTEDVLGFVGTSGTDSIHVDATGADLISGSPGENEVTYAVVADLVTLDGGQGDDSLFLRAYHASVAGGPGDDDIIGQASVASAFAGDAGSDSVTIADNTGIIVQATSSNGDYTVNRSGTIDALTGVETVEGDSGPDFVLGSAGTDQFVGGPGNDRFVTLGGNDIVEGGDGVDRFSMGDATGSLDVNLTDLTSVGDGTDSFAGVEALEGSPQADRFAGDPRNSGVIFIDGVGGRDVLDLRSATYRQFVWTTPDEVNSAPSWVRLMVRNVRRIQGSDRGDRIEVGDVNGDELRARFSGQGGDDVLVGGIHHDVLRGGAGDDTLNGKARRDVCYGGDGNNPYINC
jgi:Ca2+-binding RTX toxin-like protein